MELLNWLFKTKGSNNFKQNHMSTRTLSYCLELKTYALHLNDATMLNEFILKEKC